MCLLLRALPYGHANIAFLQYDEHRLPLQRLSRFPGRSERRRRSLPAQEPGDRGSPGRAHEGWQGLSLRLDRSFILFFHLAGCLNKTCVEEKSCTYTLGLDVQSST